jgi:hypothetical protein
VQTVEVVMSYGTERLRLQSFSSGPNAVGALALRPAPVHSPLFPCDGTHAPSKAFA